MLMTGMDNDVNKALVAMLDSNDGAGNWDEKTVRGVPKWCGAADALYGGERATDALHGGT